MMLRWCSFGCGKSAEYMQLYYPVEGGFKAVKRMMLLCRRCGGVSCDGKHCSSAERLRVIEG